MPRIIGVDIPDRKKVKYALCSIYGVGLSTAEEIVKKAKVPEDILAGDLTDEHIASITYILQSNDYMVEGELRRKISADIRRLQTIGSYRGLRHRRGLPVRGQRTRTNARTRKGKKQTVGAIRDRAARKEAGHSENK